MNMIKYCCLINFRASKGATMGQFLSGTITYSKDEIGKKVVSVFGWEEVLPKVPEMP